MNHRTMIALLACPALWASVPPSTGQGGGTLDANYQVYVGDSTKPAVVVGSALPKWGQQDGARWIGPASGGRIDGNVIYQLTFTVVDLSKAKLTMSVLADPDVDINVNGTFLPQLHSYTTPDVVVLDASRGLQAGTNMIHFWVSDNGTTANLNVSFTGTLGDAASPPPKPKNTGVARYSALSLDEPVESASGQYFDTAKDLQLGGPLKFGFSRYYSSALSSSGATSALGTNWMSNFDTKITVAGTTASVLLFGGKVLTFENTGGGWRLQSPLDTIYQLATVSTGYQLLDPNTRWIYSYSSTGALTAIKDRNANSIVVTQGANGPISAADGAGRTLNFTYAGAQLVKVADQAGRTYTFAYSGGLLQSAADDASHATTYAYTPSGALLVSQQLPLGNKPATQAYDSSGRVISQTDGRGNVTRLSYDGNGTTTITDPTGNIFRQTSDTNGVVIQEIDAFGAVSNANNDSAGLRTSGGDALGNQSKFLFHTATGYVSSATDKLGNTTSYSYTAQTQTPFTFYNLSGIDYPDGTSESLTYDANGNRLSATARDGSTTTWTYDANGRATSVAAADGATTTYTWNADGTLASRRDALGNQTTYGYDAAKRLIRITDPNGGVSTFTFSVAGDTSRTYASKLPASGAATVTSDFNGFPQTSTDAAGGSTKFLYTANNKIAARTDALGNKSTYTYDSNDRVSSITDATGVATNFTYDANSRVKTISKGSALMFTYAYAADGKVASSTDALGNSTNFTYDAEGRVTNVSTSGGTRLALTYDKSGRLTGRTDALGNTEVLTLDKLGNPAQITRPGGISTSIQRNASGLPVAVTTPNGNVWTTAYDKLGRKSKVTDPLGNATSYSYTGLSLSQITWPLGTVAITQDGNGRTTKRAYSDGTAIDTGYDGEGRVISSNNVALTRDAKGRITNSNGIAIAYDGAGRMAKITYAAGKVLTYAYDSSGRLASIADWIGGKTTLAYDAASRMSSMTYPNGVATAVTRDADNRATKIVYGSLGSIAVTRDGTGNIVSADRSVPRAPGLGQAASTQFAYDGAGQLSGSTYDAMGRVTAQSGRTYTWNLASQMTAFVDGSNSEAFTYDGLGSLQTMTTGNTTRSFVFNYAMNLPALSIVRQGGADLRYYVYLPDGELLYSIEADGTRRFYHFDEMGNTAMLSDDAGALTDSYAITPYGEIAEHAGATDNPFTWQGMYGVYQAGSALFNVRERYYDASTARFISRDPVVSFDPRSSEPYAYGKGNPLRWVDPQGTEENILYYAILMSIAQQYQDLADQYGEKALTSFDPVLWGVDLSTQFALEAVANSYRSAAEQYKPKPAGDLSFSIGASDFANSGSCPKPNLENAISVPLRLNALGQLVDRKGNLITNDGGSLITNDGGSFARAGQTIRLDDGNTYIISNDGASLITNDGASIASIPAKLITNDGGSWMSKVGQQ